MQTDILTQLINDKHDVLSRLHELCIRQLRLVSARDSIALLEMFTAKQNLLDQLQSLEKRLDPFREDDPDQREWRQLEDRLACRKIAEANAKLLADVTALEKQALSELEASRDQIANRIDDAHNGARARAAYAAQSVNTPSGFSSTQ